MRPPSPFWAMDCPGAAGHWHHPGREYEISVRRYVVASGVPGLLLVAMVLLTDRLGRKFAGHSGPLQRPGIGGTLGWNVYKSPFWRFPDLSVSFRMYDSGLEQKQLPVISASASRSCPGKFWPWQAPPGSGKSLLASAILGILPGNATVSGSLRFDGEPLTPERQAKPGDRNRPGSPVRGLSGPPDEGGSPGGWPPEAPAHRAPPEALLPVWSAGADGTAVPLSSSPAAWPGGFWCPQLCSPAPG